MRSDPNRREKWPYSTVLTEPNSYIPHKTCNVSNPTPPTYHIKQRKVKWNPTQGCQTLMLTGEELGRNGGSLLLFLLPEDSWGELPVPCKAPSSDQTQKLLPHLVLALNTFLYNGSSIWSHLTGFCLSLSLSLSPACSLSLSLSLSHHHTLSLYVPLRLFFQKCPLLDDINKARHTSGPTLRSKEMEHCPFTGGVMRVWESRALPSRRLHLYPHQLRHYCHGASISTLTSSSVHVIL